MSLVVKKKAEVPPLEADTYTGICVGVVDIGEQTEKYKDVVTRVERIRFFFEVDGETIDRGNGPEPRWQTDKLSKSLNESKADLPKAIKALTGLPLEGDTFDVNQLLGKACLVDVIKKQKKDGRYWNDITGYMKLPKGTPKPTAKGELFSFDIDDDSEANMAVFEKLPEFTRKEIQESSQWKLKSANSIELDPDKMKAASAAQLPVNETAPNAETSNNMGIDF